MMSPINRYVGAQIETHNRYIEALARLAEAEREIGRLLREIKYSLSPSEALRIWAQREDARRAKDFKLADELKVRLLNNGVTLPGDGG